MVKHIIKIEGMACGMCEVHVNDAVRNAFQVKKVTSSHTKKQTVIIAEKDIPVSLTKGRGCYVCSGGEAMQVRVAVEKANIGITG